jgi:hypothetical protein
MPYDPYTASRSARIFSFPALLGAVILLSILAAAPFPVARADPVQSVVLGGLEIALRISAAGHTGIGTVQSDAATGSEGPHKLVVTLRDRKTRKAIDDARITAYVAEQGYVGTGHDFAREHGSTPGQYTATAYMPARAAYRILVGVQLPGAARAREAQFEFRHHH